MADTPPEIDPRANAGVVRPEVPPADAGVVRPEVPPGDAGFLPASPPRAGLESIVVRVIATAGVVGIGTAIGAILSSSDVSGWIIGLVVSLVSVVLAGMLWRSRRL